MFELNCHQFADTALRQLQQMVELIARERSTFTCSLHFDKLTGISHHDISIYLSIRVFSVVQVE